MKVVPEHILRLMSPDQRKQIGQLTATEADSRCMLRLEREEQRTFSNWLVLHERAGSLVWNQPSPVRKSTIRTGWPDFSIYRNGKALFIEMKANGAKQTEAQLVMGFQIEKQGFDYVICRSAKEAIEVTRRRLFVPQWNKLEAEKVRFDVRQGRTVVRKRA